MDATPLDGYKKIIVTIFSIIAGSIGLFVTDPAKAQTIGQFLIDVLGPAAITLVGIIYTVIQGSIDKEKVKATTLQARAGVIKARNDSPKAEGAEAEQPAAAQPVQAAAETYKPVDLDIMLQSVDANIKHDGQAITPLTRAIYFWPLVTNFDLRAVPRQYRISESKRLVQKALDLFTEAFKWYTKLDTVPTPAQAANRNSFMLELKKAFERANNMLCSNKTFEELRYLLGDFNNIYTAIEGLDQLEGKTIDWSIYGEAGNAGYGPLQVGWDYAKLL